jgi:hypothetical protein
VATDKGIGWRGLDLGSAAHRDPSASADNSLRDRSGNRSAAPTLEKIINFYQLDELRSAVLRQAKTQQIRSEQQFLHAFCATPADAHGRGGPSPGLRASPVSESGRTRDILQGSLSGALMSNTLLDRRLRRPSALGRWLAVAGLLLLVAACAAGGSTGNSDTAKNNNGFYGSIIGGR